MVLSQNPQVPWGWEGHPKKSLFRAKKKCFFFAGFRLPGFARELWMIWHDFSRPSRVFHSMFNSYLLIVDVWALLWCAFGFFLRFISRLLVAANPSLCQKSRVVPRHFLCCPTLVGKDNILTGFTVLVVCSFKHQLDYIGPPESVPGISEMKE